MFKKLGKVFSEGPQSEQTRRVSIRKEKLEKMYTRPMHRGISLIFRPRKWIVEQAEHLTRS
jgi:hypothetical protein